MHRQIAESILNLGETNFAGRVMLAVVSLMFGWYRVVSFQAPRARLLARPFARPLAALSRDECGALLRFFPCLSKQLFTLCPSPLALFKNIRISS